MTFASILLILGLALDTSFIFGQPHRCVLGPSARKDLVIGLQGVLDSLKLIPPLGLPYLSGQELDILGQLPAKD